MTDPSRDGFETAPATPFWLVSEARSIALALGSYVIGRGGDADVAFPNDSKLSRSHARLVVGNESVEIEDLGSTNGTWVDRELVQHPLVVPVGAHISLGSQVLQLRRPLPRRKADLVITSRELPRVSAEEDDATDRPTDVEGVSSVKPELLR